jgi:sulfur carrier protein
MKTLTIIVNGKSVILKESMTLENYLKSMDYELLRIAVEKNGVVIPKNDFASEMVCDGDTLEIVCFVGGG